MSTSQLPTRHAGGDPDRISGDDVTRVIGGDEPTAHARTEVVSGRPEDPGAILLGRYRIQKRLGAGAFGTVFSARDERLDRDVAVKVLPRAHVVHARFEREARAAARLQHPAIVTLYEAAVDDEGAYLVSELVRGKTLDDLLDAGRLSDREIVEIGIDLCDALAHAHSLGVIHRDVKPSNVLVPSRPGPASGRAKLTDFGVAQVAGGDSLTMTGDVIGTLAYMAPEQAEGREVGPEADLYSLALVLYEALTGLNPVRDQARGRGRRAATFVPPLRRQRRDLPRELAAGIDQALRPRAPERGTVGDLRASLVACVDLADDTRGVVAPGWRAPDPPTEVGDADQELGPEWGGRGDDEDEPRRRLFAGGGPLAATAGEAGRLPAWLPRGLNAAAAGLTAAWLAIHLLPSTPVAPATAGLVAAALTLLLPRLGWGAVVVMVAAVASGQGRTAGGLVLLAISLPPMILLGYTGAGSALPGGAAALGALGLAGAWPAVVASSLSRWWHRAVVGAAGFVWLIAAGAAWDRNLYWLPADAPRAHRWMTSTHVALHELVIPIVRSGVLGGAAVWAVAAVVLPLLRTRRWPLVDLTLVIVVAAVTVVAVEACGAHDLRDAVLGAGVGAVLSGWPALVSIVRQAGYRSQENPSVL